MRFHPIRTTILTACLWACLMSAARGAEPESGDGAYERWIEYYQQVAGEYEIKLDRPRAEFLELRRDPVHVYHHPDGAGLKEHLGALFVWTHGGRPEVVGAIWSYPHGGPGQRNIVHEFQSLSRSSLTASRTGGLYWSPNEAGIELQPVPGAPSPAKSRGLRLAQLRALARQFSGHNNLFGKELDLRLTAQPLYRYKVEDEEAEDGKSDLLDGAVFVYFMDWDPEIFLLIEARRDAAGEPEWQYAAARFSDKPLNLKHEGVEVWTADAKAHVNHACGGPDESFYAVHGVDLHKLEPETTGK